MAGMIQGLVGSDGSTCIGSDGQTSARQPTQVTTERLLAECAGPVRKRAGTFGWWGVCRCERGVIFDATATGTERAFGAFGEWHGLEEPCLLLNDFECPV